MDTRIVLYYYYSNVITMDTSMEYTELSKFFKNLINGCPMGSRKNDWRFAKDKNTTFV